MNPKIEILEEKKLIGLSIKMSLASNKTGQLWGQFAPRIKDIQNRTSEDKISMQIYPPAYFKQFNPNTEFKKWATVEVTDSENIPNGMKSFILKGGLYAVFDYKGSSSDSSIFQYIFSEWIPNSIYEVDINALINADKIGIRQKIKVDEDVIFKKTNEKLNDWR